MLVKGATGIKGRPVQACGEVGYDNLIGGDESVVCIPSMMSEVTSDDVTLGTHKQSTKR